MKAGEAQDAQAYAQLWNTLMTLFSQIDAIIDNITEEMGKAGYSARRTEGGRNSGWILIDYTDVVVHVFSRDDRLFYDLERIWRDGKNVDIQEL